MRHTRYETSTKARRGRSGWRRERPPSPPRRLTAGRRAVITAIRRPSSRVGEVRLVGNREIKAWESARGGRLTGCAPADGTGIQISRTADPVEAACELTEAQAVLELRLSTNETAPTNGAHS